MKDKLIGLVILVVLCVGVVFLATSEAGFERINDSKTAGFVSNPAFVGGLSTYAMS